MTLLFGRYAVGVEQLQAGGGAQVLEQARGLEHSPEERVRLAIVAGEVSGAEEALNRLDKALEAAGDEEAAEDEGAAAAPPPAWLADDAQAMGTIYSDGPQALSEDQRRGLIERHGWFGELALSYGVPESDPLRERVLAKAWNLLAAVLAGVAVAAVAALAGLALLIVAIVQVAHGRLRPRYAPPAPGGSVYLEAFAIFIIGFIVINVIAGAAQMAFEVDVSSYVIWLLPLAALWPLARGADFNSWRFALGWHRGSGVAREIGAGVVGYIAGLPIFGMGVLLMLLLVVVQGLITGGDAPPTSHPIIDEVAGGGVWNTISLYLLAAVWAPFTEETLFRGAFYHHLRARLSAIVAGLIVGFVFAIIHPQGWVAVPALMGLALVFSLIREWRGSIIGCMVAHAMHNAAIVTVLILAIS